MWRPVAIAALLVAGAVPGRAGGAEEPRSRYQLSAEIPPGLARIEGVLRARIVNDASAPVDALTIWLYPNVFAREPAGVTAVNREYYQPSGPGRGGIEVRETTVDGRPVAPVAIEAPPAPEGTAWLLPLPTPLAPGAAVGVELGFRTLVPERLGPLSTNGRILTATGGWHPYFTAGDAREPGATRRPPDADFSVEVRVPPRFTALVGGEFGPQGEHVGPFVPLWVRPPAVRAIPTAGGRVWPDRARPEAGPGCSFPEPAPIPGEWIGDDVAEAFRQIDRWADEAGLPDPGPIELFIVPLASEVALATGGGVAVSDRYYSVPPLAAVRRLHDRALARAVLAERLLPWVRSREAPADVPQVADALGAYLGQPRPRQDHRPRRRAGVARAVARYLDPGAASGPFLAALEAVTGDELGAFWRAWNERLYREDLRVRIVRREEVPGGHRTAIEVRRVGDAPPEVIEVAVEDGGARRTLVWRAGEGERSRTFEVETAAPVERVRVDPRQRITQAAVDRSHVPALGDVDPGRLQFLVTRVGLAYSVPDRSPYGELELALRRREDVRRRLGLGAVYRKARIGGRSYVGMGFGPLIDATRYAYGASVGLEGDYLRSGFGGEGARAGFALGPTFSLGYDDRPPVPTADRGNALVLGLSASVGQAAGGNPVYYGGASLGGLHLEPLGHGHALALRLRGSVLGGSPPVQELLPLGGADEGIRGFTLEEVLGEQRLVGGLEWRLPLLRALNENLLVGRLRSVGAAIFAEGAWMGDIRLADGRAASPASALFGDVGMGLRFRYDFLGVQPLVISVDAALPMGRPERIERAPITVQLRSGQPFSSP